MQPAPGAEFLLERLQRAQAIPSADRSPDVAAFVESVALLRRAAQLLPLEAGGTPALPDGPATRRRMLQAMLLRVRADYISPETPVSDLDPDIALAAYDDRYPLRGTTHGPLALALRNYCLVARGRVNDPTVDIALTNMQLLCCATLRPYILCELLDMGSWEMAGGGGQARLALPTLTELLHASACQLIRLHVFAPNLPTELRPGSTQAKLSAGQQAALQAAAALAADNLLRWEPRNPKSHAFAAKARPDNLHLTPGAQLRAAGVAREHGSLVYQVQCAFLAARGCFALAGGALESALQEFEAAQAALRRCKGLLPQGWTVGLQELAAAVTPAAAAGRAWLHAERATNSRRQAAKAAAAEAADASAAALRTSLESLLKEDIAACTSCSHCGCFSVGLRRCARCRGPQYCSVKCQHAAWRDHRPHCKPAA
ncbi:hypothetical protein ABPG75_010546 [Micractinium tetrahymenae]